MFEFIIAVLLVLGLLAALLLTGLGWLLERAFLRRRIARAVPRRLAGVGLAWAACALLTVTIYATNTYVGDDLELWQASLRMTGALIAMVLIWGPSALAAMALGYFTARRHNALLETETLTDTFR